MDNTGISITDTQVAARLGTLTGQGRYQCATGRARYEAEPGEDVARSAGVGSTTRSSSASRRRRRRPTGRSPATWRWRSWWANADGQVTSTERAWLVGYFAAKGYPSEVIEEVEKMAPPDLSAVPPLMDLGILKMAGRILIYDAIRAVSAGGYHPSEREAVRTVARALHVDAATVDELERQVEAEEEMKARRIKLLMPDGSPNLHPRYRP